MINARKRINEAIVRQAIGELAAQGKKTSVRALLAHIGYGSMATIAKYKNQIEHNPVSVSSTAAEPADPVFHVAHRVLLEILPVLEERIQSYLEDSLASFKDHDYQDLQQHFQTLEEELRHKENELRDIRQLYHSVLADRSEKTRTAIALKQRVHKLKQELEEKESQLQQLQAQINEAAGSAHSLVEANVLQLSGNHAGYFIDYSALIAWNMP
ncbi:DNA-binding protein [Thioflexithrix psekupsensis]|uniref:KfrA N-terminal DNA-binding domain-containing protein n=1 Tax=Thioflexithrix psekupsensis TaxID=1570016 RepID=A0A251X7C4_9GAMM|nr:DNA-binding protein [Thioflexithrix psekupsensis]OUD13089.1 hypothetical protein TPSD3_10595 [Thioflexithrix psekupsensis]